MQIKTIHKLCCPFDHADLNLTTITTDLSGEEIIEGFFVCQRCTRIYPIIKGIPIMSPDEYREVRLEKPIIDRWEKYLKGKEFSNFRLGQSIEKSWNIDE